MNVTGSANRNAQLIPQFNYSSVIVPQLFNRIGLSLSHHKFVVHNRLNLQIIVKPCKLLYFLFRPFINNRPEKLSRFAGASENQSFPMLQKL